MLNASTLYFLEQLKINNHKEWFENNRNLYNNAKANYLQLVTDILKELSKTDASLSFLQAKDCTYRINRDVRFSKNKAPYKTNMGAGISKGGKKLMLAGYYLHCEPSQSFIAAGVWMPLAPELKKIRQEIDYSFEEFKTIVEDKSLQKLNISLEKGKDVMLTRPPKGYDELNPAIDFLKMKSFILSTSISDKTLTSKHLVDTVVTACNTMKPFIDFLNRGLEG